MVELNMYHISSSHTMRSENKSLERNDAYYSNLSGCFANIYHTRIRSLHSKRAWQNQQKLFHSTDSSSQVYSNKNIVVSPKWLSVSSEQHNKLFSFRKQMNVAANALIFIYYLCTNNHPRKRKQPAQSAKGEKQPTRIYKKTNSLLLYNDDLSVYKLVIIMFE